MIKTLLLASLAYLATATQPRQSFDCGTNTEHASADFLKTIQSLHSPQTSGSNAARAASILEARDKNNNSAISVDAVFHIIAKASDKGEITSDMPNAQVDTLNTAYKDYGISFNLINVTWTTNDVWAVGDSSTDLDMKKALRQGTYSTLNIYFHTDLSGGVLGRCTLPSSVGSASTKVDASAYVNDGCNVNANTMPNGNMDGYNMGKTAVHETGHWFGLLHTFEGNSCDGPGDYIDDTPYEKESTDGCPTSPPKSTCPNQSGSDRNDPIHNYMDYSIDSCYTGFTKLQHDRMHALFNLYRDGN